MKRFMSAAFASIIASAFGGALHAQAVVSEVDVIVELEDAANANALEYWPSIETDLESLLEEKLAGQMANEGHDVTVRLAEVSLDGSPLLGTDGEFNTLKGWIYIREPGDPDPVESVGISLNAEVGEGDEDALINLNPSIDDMYRALLDRFAERTIEEVEAI